MKKEPGMHYNTKTLNKVFAVLSVVFLIAVVWSVLDDFIRPWKVVQIKAMKIKEQVLLEKVKEEEKSIDGDKLRELQSKITDQEKLIVESENKIKEINKKLSENRKKQYVQKMLNGISGSKAGEFQFKYEHANVEGDKVHLKEYKAILDKWVAEFTQGKDDLKTQQAEEKDLVSQLNAISNEKNELEKETKKILGSKERLLASIEASKPNPVFFLRNSPFIDYLDPTIKINQIVLPHITEDRYFQQTPKVDRCTTCHVFIDQPGFESQENPYKTHPRVDSLAVGLNSAHPMKQFGCTSCHQGEGHRVVDFNSPVHIPQNKEQAKVWAEKYHWHAPHKIPQPMFPLQYTQASCTKCHQGVEKIAMADKLNKGKQLIENYGCYGCHKIEGWTHLKKPGPSLLKINAKTSKEFIKNWIWSPHSFNPNSRMPAFFNQSNNSDPESIKKNIAEVNAMAEYIWAKSKNYQPFMKYTGGNAEAGKNLIQTVGCIACHQVEGIDEPFNKVKSLKGPYLTGTGSKVDPDWLVSWLKKPSHYQEDTVMPSFRLSDKEAGDITSYLMTLKNKKFAELQFENLDKNVRDELLVGYFSQFDPLAQGKAKLEKLSDEERTMELGSRSIGKYGCYSCHSIEGFAPDRAPIGPELTNVGSKFVHQFGFGQQGKNVGHTREDWFTAHLKNPRIWDVGVPKAFNDLNRMPNFYLNDEEIEYMVTALLGQVSDFVPLAGRKNLNAEEKIAEDGRKIANKYNCYGCHKIDGMGGDILAAYDDANVAPPYLVKEGHRVQSDWLYNFLTRVHPIRPYVSVRMPSFNFSTEEINKIINYFQADAGMQPTYIGRWDFMDMNGNVKWEAGEKEAAKKLFTDLACTSCHTGGFNNDTPQGPDLHYAKKRLRPTWVHGVWLKNPSAVMDYTVMPNFWENGTISAVDGVLENNPEKQMYALMKYIFDFGYDKSPTPFPNQPQDVATGKREVANQ
jgi:mono/diheme cytochrome c family protein